MIMQDLIKNKLNIRLNKKKFWKNKKLKKI